MSKTALHLEQIHTPELPARLLALYHNDCVVQVSIASAPVGRCNDAALTVRPFSVWKRLFDLAGFDATVDDVIGDEPDHGEGEWSASSHWSRMRPFRDDSSASRRLVSLRRRAAPNACCVNEMARILGIRAAVAPPPRLVHEDTHLAFLVGTYQEFRQYQPIWAQLPTTRVSVLLRDGARDVGWIRRAQCMEAWLTARAIPWQKVGVLGDIDWSRWRQPDRVLIVGADSTAFRSHVLNAAVIVDARRHGWRTIQLQHGIWPYADLTSPMTMLSELVLTWSNEFKSSLDAVTSWPDGRLAPRGIIDDSRFVVTGCPGFDRYRDRAGPTLDELLGDWVAPYRRRVLVATNLHWSQHKYGDAINPAILRLASQHPDTLFIVKTHPAHDPDRAFVSACPPNVQVLDEFCCLFADLDSARLVLATDAVISTHSTIVLEASLARRPFLVIDTGNPNGYQHVTTVAPDHLSNAFATLIDAPHDSRSFRDHYVAPASLGRGTIGVLESIAAELSRETVVGPVPAALVSFAHVVSMQAVEHLALEEQLGRQRIADHALTQKEELLAHLNASQAWLRQLVREKDAALLRALPSRPLRVALFGASTAGNRYAARLRGSPRVCLHCYLDNDPDKWGAVHDGLPILKPEPAVLSSVDVIVVSSIHADAIGHQLTAAGFGAKLILDPSVLVPAPMPDSIVSGVRAKQLIASR